MPNAYFLLQSHQEQLADNLESEDLMNTENYHLPQRKMGSMTDTQQYTGPDMQDIRSEETLEMTGSASMSHEGTKANANKGTTNQGKVSVTSATWCLDHNSPPPSTEPSIEPSTTWTRTRIIRPPERFCHDVAFIGQAWDSIWEVQDYEIQEELQDPLTFVATLNPDTMYYHEALRAPDQTQFLEVMKKEVSNHEARKHWELVPWSNMPSRTTILPAIWSMKCKHCIQTNKIYKWKATHNIHDRSRTNTIGRPSPQW